jgi:hypothetical protein
MKITQIEYISSLETIDPDNDNIDVHVTLDNGQVYSFVVATPVNIYWCMENQGVDYFFGVPPVFVKQLTVENMERAFNAIINENGGEWLDIYGALQT